MKNRKRNVRIILIQVKITLLQIFVIYISAKEVSVHL